MIDQLQADYVARVRSGGALVTRYRAFLLDPGTIVTAACLLLLIGAGLSDPAGFVGGNRAVGSASSLYLVAAVGLTVAGVLSPVTGALLHELSSLPVIANSARLIGRRGTS